MTVETLNPPAADATGTVHQALDRLLRPRSVVIVGASDKPGALGASVLSNLSRNGFAGDIQNDQRPDHIAGIIQQRTGLGNGARGFQILHMGGAVFLTHGKRASFVFGNKGNQHVILPLKGGSKALSSRLLHLSGSRPDLQRRL